MSVDMFPDAAIEYLTRPEPITLEKLRMTNRSRRDSWRERDGATTWTGADWSNEMCGETGEAANVVKKLRRHETGVKGANDPDETTLREMLADELADVLITADLTAMFYDIDLTAALRRKFNATSEEQGLKERL